MEEHLTDLEDDLGEDEEDADIIHDDDDDDDY